MKIKPVLIFGVLLIGCRLALATSISIPDFSFEGITTTIVSPTALGVGVIGTNSGPVGAWSALSGTSIGGLMGSISSGTTNSLGAPGGADGSYVVRINMPTGAGSSVDLNQGLGVTFLANSTYTLSFEIDAGSTATLLSGSSLSLQAGSTPVATLSGTAFTSLLSGNNQFQTLSLIYQSGNVAPVGDIGIAFNANSTAGAGGNFFLDNFQLGVTPIPEPSTYALCSLGLFLTIFACHRRRSDKVVF